MENITINHPSKKVTLTLDIAASKSESNRALIIKALAGGNAELSNLANARDTETMQHLLSTNEKVRDVLDAGTTMRFCTAYYAISGSQHLMTGTTRMQQRPIGILVDALRELGAEIDYQKEDGYPPHLITGFDRSKAVNKLTIQGDVSSQYISALLMIAPSLPEGLTLELTGKIGSKPYIQMTLNLMEHFGIKAKWSENIISIPAQKYNDISYKIEGDWSGASYWYSIVALADEAEVELIGLRQNSNQGDSVLAKMMPQLGVATEYTERGIILTKCKSNSNFTWDFTHCPDIAQTISVICAVKGVKARLTGLESLRIKETDRIEAIKNELEKFGVSVKTEGDEAISLDGAEFNHDFKDILINTYEDHRMAMAYAPLALINKLAIEEPDVVKKSYPDFWRDLKKAGFQIK
jgi:3-phosphoshikimate 1-carboxyvinyltransferase